MGYIFGFIVIFFVGTKPITSHLYETVLPSRRSNIEIFNCIERFCKSISSYRLHLHLYALYCDLYGFSGENVCYFP